MLSPKAKAFCILFCIPFVPFFILFVLSGQMTEDNFFLTAIISLVFVGLMHGIGIRGWIQRIFEKKEYAKYERERLAREEFEFQTNLRRELERKRALSQIDNENLHYQNQLKIEYIAQVAQIQIQSNQYLMNLYEQAKINNQRQDSQSLAYQQLALIEEELRKQGYSL